MAEPSAKLSPEQLEYLRQLADEGVDMVSLFGRRTETGQSSRTPAPTSAQVSDSDLDLSPVRKIKARDDEEDCVVVEPPTAEKTSASKKRARTPTQTPRRSTRAKKIVGLKLEESEDEHRPVVPDLVLERSFLKEYHLTEVADLLTAQGWTHLFEEQIMVDEGLVREFYEHLVVEERPGMLLATFSIKSEAFSFTSRELSLMLNVPHNGFGEYVKGQWPSTISMEEVVGRVGKEVKSMSLQKRILHKLVCQAVTPRLQKHNSLNYMDSILLDKIVLREQVSLPMEVMHHMGYSAGNQSHGLPYPTFVKNILQHFKSYQPQSEVKAFTKFELDNCGRLGFMLSNSGEWVPKVESLTGKKEVVSAKKKKEGTQPAAPAVIQAVDLAPVMEKLEGMTSLLLSLSEEVHVLSGRLDAMEGKLKDTAEHTQLSLSHSLKTTEFLEELNGLLNKFGTGALEQMKLAFSRRR